MDTARKCAPGRSSTILHPLAAEHLSTPSDPIPQRKPLSAQPATAKPPQTGPSTTATEPIHALATDRTWCGGCEWELSHAGLRPGEIARDEQVHWHAGTTYGERCS